MSNLIVITGITGVQGSSVADVYLKMPGWKVRGLSRNISSAQSKAWESKGVEMVRADLNDTTSLIEAFKGAAVVFGVTDFWTIFNDAESHSRKKPGQDITEYCFEVELQQGKNLADAAATVTGLHRYIFSSMASATKWSNGKYKTLYHMDSKALAVDYAKSLPQLAGKFSQIQAPIYYNLLWEWGLPTTPKKQPDGSYRIQGVGPGDVPIPFGDVRKDFGQCVRAAVDAEPDMNLFAVGEMMSWNQYLKTWCESQNVPFGGYEQRTLQEFAEILPGGLGREFAENVLFGMEFGYEGGNDPTVVRSQELGLKMTPFKEYCEQTDFSSILV